MKSNPSKLVSPAVVAATTLLAVAAWPGVLAAQPTVTQMVPMRDDVQLATDIYLPTSGAGPWPTVLIRTPYGKAAGQSIGNNLRNAGVAAVIQDMRGRFDSQGVDCIFRCDGDGDPKDGVDTVLWIDQQAWADDELVTWGGSALGIVQYMVAPADPPGLEAMWVAVGTPSLYDHVFFQGGAFRQSLVEEWLEAQGSSFFLADVAAHPVCDSFWDSVQTEDQLATVQTPAMHVGGWYDVFAQGTLDAFDGYQHQGGAGALGAQKLVMGPWTHGIYSRTAGELTYPENAADIPAGSDTLLLLWLLHYLGVNPDQAAIDAVPTVQYYVMGDVDDPGAPGNEWRTADDWPIPAAPIRLHLQPDGSLAEACPPEGGAAAGYVYDPAAPCPTVGGANLVLPSGPHDQAEVEARSDVLVFSTPVLGEPMEITGRVRAHLWVSIDTPDTDLMVRMSDVYPDGRSMLILDGARRLALRDACSSLDLLAPGQVVGVDVDLWSTSIVIAAGHRLRISVTSSNSPRFWPNPNDGTSYGATATPSPATVTLYRDRDRPSYIEVPDPNRDLGEVTRCEPAPVDAGPGDGGLGFDGGTGQDAENPGDGSNGGCGCEAGRRGESSLPPLLWILVVGCVLRRRRL